jgi:uncharacterized protein YlxW (UPF0749 family)
MVVRCRYRLGIAVLAALGVAATTHSQTTRSGGGANAAAMAQLQQLSAERTALQAENARLKQELEEAKKRAESATSQETALKRRAQEAEAAKNRMSAGTAATAESAARTRAQLDEVVVKFRETAQVLKDVEVERNGLKQEIDRMQRELGTCRDHNAQLLTINEEVLVRLENTGLWNKLAADEPFTRLKRTELENLAADYRVRAKELAEAQAAKPAP